MDRRFVIVATLSLVVVAGLAAWRLLGPPTVRERALALRDSLHTLRARVDSCRQTLANREAYFLEYDDRLDSLRGRVRNFEELDPRGVPADSFGAYMDAFEGYNDAVPGWRNRADSLQAVWTRCKGRTRTHNALVDSLRELLNEMGEMPTDARRAP